MLFLLQNILGRVHGEAMEVLTTSEREFLEKHGRLPSEAEKQEHAWQDEKRSLLSSINALKRLLVETQRTSDASKVLLQCLLDNNNKQLFSTLNTVTKYYILL